MRRAASLTRTPPFLTCHGCAGYRNEGCAARIVGIDAHKDGLEQMAKTPEEVKLWRSQQKLDGTNATAEYKEAEGTAHDHLARLRTERVAREATAQPPKKAAPNPSVRKAKPR